MEHWTDLFNWINRSLGFCKRTSDYLDKNPFDFFFISFHYCKVLLLTVFHTYPGISDDLPNGLLGIDYSFTLLQFYQM